jgi:hypothetical protein
MSTLELKGRITEGIAVVSDEAFLMHLLEIINRWQQNSQTGFLSERQEFFAKNAVSDQQSDWWDELTAEQQSELETALHEIEYPTNLISQDDFFKSIERWKRPKV